MRDLIEHLRTDGEVITSAVLHTRLADARGLRATLADARGLRATLADA
jgi:hypothetical protein